MDGVGFLEVNSMDGETAVDQDLFYQELDAFDEVSFDLEVTDITSVQDMALTTGWDLFPNPTQDRVTVDVTVSNGTCDGDPFQPDRPTGHERGVGRPVARQPPTVPGRFSPEHGRVRPPHERRSHHLQQDSSAPMNLNLRFAFGIVALMGLSMTSCDTFDDPVIGVIAPCDVRGPGV